jgi:hypothetical protein
MGEQSLLSVSVPGIPSSYSTAKEKPWKEALNTHIPLAPLLGSVATGVIVNFRVPRPQVGHRKVDLDNLCEPLFSVLVNQKHWFGKTRPNIQWFKVTKSHEEPYGCDIALMESFPLNEIDDNKIQLPSALYEDKLPKNAKDLQFVKWVSTYVPIYKERKAFFIHLRFGGAKNNLGNISGGRIKSIIDCLYCVIGGNIGAPDDWKVIELQVQKNVPDVPEGCVHVLVSALE